MGLHLPALNATLNATAAVLLLAGFAAIRSGRRELHGRLMVSAFLVSSAFLACYLYYHVVVVRGEPTRFHAAGAARAAYLVLLLSHTILATATVPLVLRTLWLARRERWLAHRRLARWTYPIWLYVSVTGVAVYVVLYHFNPAPVLP
jgi:putative membrane protein